ncbi:acyl carrier protein [Arenibacter sp. NBRC 103722]|uniref:acyl carrier protein n=1 Tax=Arenibacter sp. NBRC 103722 TaxID=1113929 RepID=UPI000852C43C|nr:acyl carrier protein [Arenibacter sp. NBRC 103722]GBF21635.1 acyl carrier protein [Arenibacter sp. NBRC 103722]|tara:strand:+ start:1669 stop:1917 length:249 start_codon:yes stop_codon:yes gene_type:complete
MDEFKIRFNKLLVHKFGVHQNQIRPEAYFTKDLGADMLDIVELMLEFENEFNIAIPENEAEKLNTFGDAETYIRNVIENADS